MYRMPKEYIESFRTYLKIELENVNGLKQQFILDRQHDIAEQYREIEKKILSFISSLDSVKTSI
jgi:hypothetical protein